MLSHRAFTFSVPSFVSCGQVASAFSHVLNLHNLSEAVSNSQAEKAARLGAEVLSWISSITTVEEMLLGLISRTAVETHLIVGFQHICTKYTGAHWSHEAMEAHNIDL